MKFVYTLPMLLFLYACDNNTIVGTCVRNERTITTTEQNGQIITKEATELFLCRCFDNMQSDESQFIIPKDKFSFEMKYSMEPEDIDAIKQQNMICDEKCTKLCNRYQK